MFTKPKHFSTHKTCGKKSLYAPHFLESATVVLIQKHSTPIFFIRTMVLSKTPSSPHIKNRGSYKNWVYHEMLPRGVEYHNIILLDIWVTLVYSAKLLIRGAWNLICDSTIHIVYILFPSYWSQLGFILETQIQQNTYSRP